MENMFYFYPKVKEIASTLHIGQDLRTMLSFYHDLGRIIYFGNLCGERSYLSDMVILNPQWLIDVLKEVITFADQENMVSEWRERGNFITDLISEKANPIAHWIKSGKVNVHYGST